MRRTIRTVAAGVATTAIVLSASPAMAVFPDPEPHPTYPDWTCLADEHLAYINQTANDATDQVVALTEQVATLQSDKAGITSSYYTVLDERTYWKGRSEVIQQNLDGLWGSYKFVTKELSWHKRQLSRKERVIKRLRDRIDRLR